MMQFAYSGREGNNMNKLIIANWKMNPQTLDEALSLARASDNNGLVIAPPFPYLISIGKEISHATLGAQDVFWEERGAFTGEVSASELKDIGIRYVIVGHSSRRIEFHETDEMIGKKLVAVIVNTMTPVLCVGETKEEHDKGETEAVIERQVTVALSSVDERDIPIVIAYEPIWAISTAQDAKPDTPENAVQIISFIKDIVVKKGFSHVVYIYGGSVTEGNAQSFLKKNEIDGALVGGASLQADAINAIVKVAQKL